MIRQDVFTVKCDLEIFTFRVTAMAEARNTQLIITTHESRLLKDDILRNDEISFMLKTKAGSTIIKSLEKYQLRADKKIYEALFDGTLEAIPQFNEAMLEQIVENNLKDDVSE